MQDLSVKARSIMVIVMGLIAFGSTLYYRRDASDINAAPLIFMSGISLTAFGIASWLTASEKRESARIFLLGIMALSAVPFLAVFHEEISALILIGVSLVGGAYCIWDGYNMRQTPPRVRKWGDIQDGPHTVCAVCGKTACTSCKAWT